MKKLARDLRTNQTDAEQLLWRHLRNRLFMGTKFKRQQIIGPYIVDFVCFEQRLIVELDGGQHAENMECDTRRTVFLESQGFRVMRFWNNEVLSNLESVLETVRSGLTRISPHPRPRIKSGAGPLPQGEREITSRVQREQGSGQQNHRETPSPAWG